MARLLSWRVATFPALGLLLLSASCSSPPSRLYLLSAQSAPGQSQTAPGGSKDLAPGAGQRKTERSPSPRSASNAPWKRCDVSPVLRSVRKLCA